MGECVVENSLEIYNRAKETQVKETREQVKEGQNQSHVTVSLGDDTMRGAKSKRVHYRGIYINARSEQVNERIKLKSHERFTMKRYNAE